MQIIVQRCLEESEFKLKTYDEMKGVTSALYSYDSKVRRLNSPQLVNFLPAKEENLCECEWGSMFSSPVVSAGQIRL